VPSQADIPGRGREPYNALASSALSKEKISKSMTEVSQDASRARGPRFGDIDSERMLLRIEQGKGRKDRHGFNLRACTFLDIGASALRFGWSPSYYSNVDRERDTWRLDGICVESDPTQIAVMSTAHKGLLGVVASAAD
jgi:hypothetical protein